MVPDIVNDVKAGRKPYRTLKAKITAFKEARKSEEEDDSTKSNKAGDTNESDDGATGEDYKSEVDILADSQGDYDSDYTYQTAGEDTDSYVEDYLSDIGSDAAGIDSAITGSWVYNLSGNDIIYTFNPDGSGSIEANGYSAHIGYETNNNIITMSYYDDYGTPTETEVNLYEINGDSLLMIQDSGSGPKNELKRYYR